jgi:hypothetical protein
MLTPLRLVPPVFASHYALDGQGIDPPALGREQMAKQHVSTDTAHSARKVFLDALRHRDWRASASAGRVLSAALVYRVARVVDLETVQLLSHYC